MTGTARLPAVAGSDPRRPASRRGDEHGLTLVEVLVAAAILAIAILPLFYALGYGLKGVRSGRDAAVASALAEQAVEEAKAQARRDSGNLADLVDPAYGADQGLEGYTLERTVENDVNDWTGMKKVSVRILKDGRTLASVTFLIYKEGF